MKGLPVSLDGNWTRERPPAGGIAKRAEPSAVNSEMLASVIRGAMQRESDTTGSSMNPHDDDDPSLGLADSLKEMGLAAPDGSRFLGKSSGGMLVQTAVELKNEYTSMVGNRQKMGPQNRRAEFWCPKPVC